MSAAKRSDRTDLSTAGAMERWTQRRTGSPLLAQAIGLAAEAEAQGHACARLASDAFDLPGLRALHTWVGDGSAPTPTVLTENGDFFLWRNWRHESRIVDAIAARVETDSPAIDTGIDEDLAILFADGHPSQAADPAAHAAKAEAQRRAVRQVVGKRFFILSGGPGTGKTTTVLRMLLMLQRVSGRNGRLLSVALAAPTGKAAQRLSQSLRDGADQLRERLAPNDQSWHAALDRLPDSARTLHRLLGFQQHTGRPGFDSDHPLPFDLVVVDEASMVDLGLMRALLDALAPHAALILLGDPDQLVSVSAGSVLADLVASAEQPPLAEHHVRLRHVWRTQGRLAEVYEAVRIGRRAALAPLLTPEIGAQWHPVDNPNEVRRRLLAWMRREEWTPLDQITGTPDSDPSAAFAALRRLQLLTALREGPFGAAAINDWIDTKRRRSHEGTVWYPGRPIMVRHNDYSRRLFNGDIGLTIRHQGQLVVCFESTDADGRIGYRHLSPRELPEHDLGYALTIHKSQGSEYDHVAVLLPPEADNRILSRQLLYTGVSRAKRSVEIWSADASLTAALETLSERNGGLRRRFAALRTGATDPG